MGLGGVGGDERGCGGVRVVDCGEGVRCEEGSERSVFRVWVVFDWAEARVGVKPFLEEVWVVLICVGVLRVCSGGGRGDVE